MRLFRVRAVSEYRDRLVTADTPEQAVTKLTKPSDNEVRVLEVKDVTDQYREIGDGIVEKI